MKKCLFFSALLVVVFAVSLKVVQAQTAILGNDNYLAATQIHHKFTAWNAVQDHLISGYNRIEQQYGYCEHGYYGQSPCESVNSCCRQCKHRHRGAWANYFGRDSHYTSSYNNNDWHILSDGIQAGTDILKRHRSQIGMFFGYEDSTGTNNTGAGIRDHLKAKDYYVGVYGVHILQGGADLRTILNFGWQNYNSQRNETNNLFQTGFHGNTVELNIDLGKRHYFGECCGGMWSTRPAFAIDWYYNRLGDAQETPGGVNALWYQGTNFSQLFFRFGTDLRYERGRWALEGGLFYSYDLRGADLWSRVSDSNDNSNTLIGSGLGRSIFSFNIGGSYLLGRNLTLFGGYRGETAPERTGKEYTSIGHAGVAWRW
jgi:outer membrane autotransporter protein